MKKEFGKIFRDTNSKSLKIEMKKYNMILHPDYYSFIREQSDLNLVQVIINSHMMIKLLTYYFIDESFDIQTIELAEDDIDFSRKIEGFISILKSNRLYIHKLLNELSFLAEEDCIEISKLSLIKVQRPEESIFIDIKANGIIGINEKYYPTECVKFSKAVEQLYRSR